MNIVNVVYCSDIRYDPGLLSSSHFLYIISDATSARCRNSVYRLPGCYLNIASAVLLQEREWSL